MNPSSLLTSSLRAHPRGDAITRVLAAALDAVDPAAAVRRYLGREGDTFFVGDAAIDLAAIDRVLLVGAGKAGAPMASAVAAVLGERLSAGIIVVKEGHGAPQAEANLYVREASHPLPDERGAAATAEIVRLVADAGEHDLVITLISGGGSALLTQPVDGVTLADMQQLTGLLLGCGASIDEINTLRKHLDTVKGGGLARLAHPARLVSLILSDVVGNPLDVIASGPTVADPSTYGDALAILQRYGMSGETPLSIMSHLERGAAGDIAETPKPGDPRLSQVLNQIVGSNLQAAQAALAQAGREHFNTLLLTTFLQGEAREAGRMLAAIAREIAGSGNPIPRPACLVLGGETTVTLRGNGLGGRNQELALAAVADVAELADIVLVTLATDGGDGPTDAAGAVVTGETLAQAHAQGLKAADFLARNDAYHFFAPLDDLLRPGATRTNVNDLALLFVL